MRHALQLVVDKNLRHHVDETERVPVIEVRNGPTWGKEKGPQEKKKAAGERGAAREVRHGRDRPRPPRLVLRHARAQVSTFYCVFQETE